jgi:hypothetical protein
MVSVYILEIIGTTLLAFLLSLLGKGYGHILFGTTLLLTGTLFVHNCFNPAIALCYFLTNKITFTNFIYYIIIEFPSAVTGFMFGNYIKELYF